MASLVSWMMFFYLYASFSGAAEIEFIGEAKKSQLAKQFKNARFSVTTDFKTLKNQAWTCDMYGVRSGLQVQRALKLYRWAPGKGSKWHNEGAQVVTDYTAKSEALVGVKKRFEDQVKLTSDGQIISRLSLRAPPQTVIAYSVCQTE